MNTLTKYCDTVTVRNTSDIVLARSCARALAARLGFGKADQTRLATAVSELTRNVIMYAGSGECNVTDTSDAEFNRIEITVKDHGPGIADIELAMQDGFSTGGSMGAGLAGTRRLVEDFSLESAPGLTKVTVSLSLRRT